MRTDLHRRIRKIEAKLPPYDEFAGMTVDEVGLLVDQEVASMVKIIGSFDAFILWVRESGYDDQATTLVEMYGARGW
jgi:hypothetical protein